MCYASSRLLNKKGEQNLTRIQKTPLLGVQQGEFIDFVFLFIHQTKLRHDTEYPTGKQSNLTVRGYFFGNCINSNKETSQVAET
jgi:hypothetical protein